MLAGVADLAPAPFDPERLAFTTRRLHLLLFHDEFAYADRLNDDLTVFRRGTKEPTGFKIKNVARILEEGDAQMAAPDLKVACRLSFSQLFAANPKTSIEVYSVLIALDTACGPRRTAQNRLSRWRELCPAVG